MAKSRFKSNQKGTPEYRRRQRRIALRKSAPKPDPLRGEIDATANLRYGDAERSLQGEDRVSDAASARIPGYFQEYQQRLQQLRGAQQTGYAAAQADIQRTSAGSAAMAQQGNQNAMGQAQQQANVTGGTVDVGAQQRAAGSIATRQDAVNTFSGGLRARQAEANTFSLGREAVGEGEKINQLIKERGRKKEIGTKLADLSKEKGEYKVKAREDLIEQRHKRILERKAFGLKVSEAEQNALDDAIKNQTAQDRIDIGGQNAATGKARLTETQRHNQAMENKKAAGKDGKRKPAYTRLQKRQAHEQLRSAVADAKAIKPKKGEGKSLVDYLRQGDPGANRKGESRPKRDKYPPAIARAAAMYAIYGRIDAKTRKMLMEDYGIGGV